MIGKNTIKLIKSLSSKKIRLKENLFLVEGDKNVAEVLNSSFLTEKLFATTGFISENKSIVINAKQIVEVQKNEIEQASLLKTPQNSIALCKLPDYSDSLHKILPGLSVFLDDIQDPGNLGTIIRTCDWFGIDRLFCSVNTADVFNPKVIQATMGSFCRVQVIYLPSENLAKLAKESGTMVFGAFLEGENMYEAELPANSLLVMGNEGNGISKGLEKIIDRKIKIPNFSENRKGAESLNVSVATAILCAEFKRRTLSNNHSK